LRRGTEANVPGVVERVLQDTVFRRDPHKERSEEQASEHGLFELQRAAGNRAVAQLLQRAPRAAKEERLIVSKVAVATGAALYSGKCDADLSAPTVDVEWSRRLMGKQREIIFECGPQSFRFRTFRGWFDDDRFPWTLDTTDGGDAFVTDPVEGALDDIYDDSDAGSRFWHGYHVVKDALKSDLDAFCGN